jgi:hypothetical protein
MYSLVAGRGDGGALRGWGLSRKMSYGGMVGI